MKGLDQYLDFIRVRGRDAVDMRDLVISTEAPHIVGAIRMFAYSEAQENYRLQFLEKMEEPHFFAKAHGYRIYITLWGGLSSLPNTVLQDKVSIRNTLARMVQYYADECISDGMRREYADEQSQRIPQRRKWDRE